MCVLWVSIGEQMQHSTPCGLEAEWFPFSFYICCRCLRLLNITETTSKTKNKIKFWLRKALFHWIYFNDTLDRYCSVYPDEVGVHTFSEGAREGSSPPARPGPAYFSITAQMGSRAGINHCRHGNAATAMIDGRNACVDVFSVADNSVISPFPVSRPHRVWGARHLNSDASPTASTFMTSAWHNNAKVSLNFRP